MRIPSTCLILALALTALLPACRRGGGGGTGVPEPPRAEPFPPPVRVYYDNGGGIQDSIRSVIRDGAALRAIWERATSLQASPPPPPEIDFDREMIVVAGAGRMTPDDQIQVDSAYTTREMNPSGDMEETLNIVVRTIRGCRQFNADAYPLDIVRVRRFEGRVRFVERTAQAEGCRPPDAPGGR